MANKLDNLMPIQEVNSRRTREQHSRDSRKAGKKSAEIRAKRKSMKETLQYLLGEKDTKGRLYQDLVTLGLLANAIDKRKGGSPEAYKTILATLGELSISEEEKARVTIINDLPRDDEDE